MCFQFTCFFVWGIVTTHVFLDIINEFPFAVVQHITKPSVCVPLAICMQLVVPRVSIVYISLTQGTQGYKQSPHRMMSLMDWAVKPPFSFPLSGVSYRLVFVFYILSIWSPVQISTASTRSFSSTHTHSLGPSRRRRRRRRQRRCYCGACRHVFLFPRLCVIVLQVASGTNHTPKSHFHQTVSLAVEEWEVR